MSSAGLLQVVGGIRVNSKVIGDRNLLCFHTLIKIYIEGSVSILILFGNGKSA